MNYFRQLDGFRFIAVFMVFIHHWLSEHIWAESLLKKFPFGSGVTLFFVISGFLITRILINFKVKNSDSGRSNWHSIKSFFVRRSLRIFPIYFITIFFLYFIDFANTRELFPWLVTYTSNVKMALSNEYLGAFTHLWSLAVEEQFYIVWAFVVSFVPLRYLKKVIIGSIIVAIGSRMYLAFFSQSWMGILTLTPCKMDSLGLGALLGYWSVFEKEKIVAVVKSKKLFILITLVTFWMLFDGYFRIHRMPSVFFENTLISLVCFYLIARAALEDYSGYFSRFLENKVVLYLGKISYGLYLYHTFASPLFFKFINTYLKIGFENPVWYSLVYLILTVAMSVLSWHIIESPINGLKKYFTYVRK